MVDANWIDILDVSAAQGGAIDFHRVAAAKVAPGVDRCWRGVYIKVAENETAKDPTRVAHIAGARAAGLPWGAYVYLHPQGDMAKEIANAYAAIGDTMPDFPLALDFEAADPSLTAQQLVDQLRRARDAAMTTFGRGPLGYSFPNFWTTRMMPAIVGATDLAEVMLWWAFYGAGLPWYPRRDQLPKAPDPWFSAGKPITLWQDEGNTKKVPGATWDGRVDGINGDVDRSVFTLGEDAFLYDFCGRPRTAQSEGDVRIVHALDLQPRASTSDDDST